MSKKLCLQRKPSIIKLLVGCFIILSFVLANTAFAINYKQQYNPPSKPSRPTGRTGSHGSRSNGCMGNAKTSFTVLAPRSHIGQTASSQPTFAWYVPDKEPRETELHLYELTQNGKDKRIEKIKLESSQGIMTYSLPKEKLSLSVGQKYRWQVVLLCNPNHPSEALVADAQITVVGMSNELKTQLTKTTEPVKRGELYAEAGFWYDALAEVTGDPKNKVYSLKLLEDLSNLEAQAAKTAESSLIKALKEQALQLQQIVAFEQQQKLRDR